MSYHDRNLYKTQWSNPKKEVETENPKLQIISPQKKLHDIQQILNELPEKAMTVVQLQETIQNILDGQ